MGTREHYGNGVFSYVELGTSDVAGAQAFYATLFGWTYEDVPLPGGLTYHPASRDGARVAALFGSESPPVWLSYVTVANLDATAGRVAALGGTLVQAPFDVLDQGRMAVVTDPTGATLALWEARTNPGAALVNAPGALAWNDLQTTDVEAAEAFYTALLGWTVAVVEGAPDERRSIAVGTGKNGGIAKLADAAAQSGVPSHWLAFFAVSDVAASTRTAAEAGATVVAGPLPLPGGSMAVLRDPQGVMFGIVDGEMDD